MRFWSSANQGTIYVVTPYHFDDWKVIQCLAASWPSVRQAGAAGSRQMGRLGDRLGAPGVRAQWLNLDATFSQ